MQTDPTPPSHLRWRRIRWTLVLLGVLLPYVAQLGHARGWQLYMDSGWAGHLLLAGMGAVLWLPLWALTWCYQDTKSIWPPAVLGLGAAFWMHVSVDLTADAQAGLAVVMVPLLALVPLAVGALMGWGMDVRARRKARMQ